ncbi:coproporphyrinogen-III oxidase family protein [Clostridiisalibacter paucivorans]|uniref:coproporphyrinogen-III oxidase family protein n=1 Tax=Clostridiisalibacter paucivorans TaxID=408753 RepID=UPI00047D97CE|nr:coproporphyrinogen-III oxidase family protein [Clostridiisalibacter paucivorans]
MITNILRRLILGKKEKFTFNRYKRGNIDFETIGDSIGLYIHIPFCKSICPYCPYNKILYDKSLAERYRDAIIEELKIYKDIIKQRKITSIYIGGGTPTLMTYELKDILVYIRNNYNFSGDIGIETHPNEINSEILEEIKNMGITHISVGVQTFNNDTLSIIGRNYNREHIYQSLELIKKFDFKCVDVDIMTNLPNQTLKDIEYDIKTVYSYDIDQLSIYPLIMFPMTGMKEAMKDKEFTRFGELKEAKVLKTIDNISKEYGYSRSSIWTYGKDEDTRYTSVTRESFIGLGAGASSYFGNYFYLNTFDVNAYIGALNKKNIAINIFTKMTDRESMAFWLFWRCYDGVIDKNRFFKMYGKDMKKEFKLLYKIMKLFKIVTEKGDKLILTDLGIYLYHMVEKRYSTHYLNDMWQQSMEEPWIKELKL